MAEETADHGAIGDDGGAGGRTDADAEAEAEEDLGLEMDTPPSYRREAAIHTNIGMPTPPPSSSTIAAAAAAKVPPPMVRHQFADASAAWSLQRCR